MGYNKDLFDLIKSLSTGEKRVVGKSLGEQKLELYNLVGSMDTYDHARVTKMFSGKTTTHISVLKGQLYGDILSTLARPDVSTQHAAIEQRIAEVDFLSRRGLFELAYDRAEDALRLAREIEAFDAMRRILRHKAHLRIIIPGIPQDPQDAEIYNLIRAGQEEVLNLDLIFERARAVLRVPLMDRTPVVEAILGDLPRIENLVSNRGKITLLRAQYLLARAAGEHLEALYFVSSIVDIFHLHKNMLGDPDLREIYFLSAFAVITYKLDEGMLESARKDFGLLMITAKKSRIDPATDIHFYARTQFARLDFMRAQGEGKEGLALIDEVMEKLRGTHDPIRTRLFQGWLFLATGFSFIEESYTRTLSLVQLFLDIADPETATQAQLVSVYLHRLAATFEQGNYDELERLVRSTSDTLRRVNCWGEYEQRMLKFFRDLCNNSLPNAQHAAFVKLHVDLEAIFSDPELWVLKNCFPIFPWIKAHVEKQPLAKTMQAK